MPAVTCPRCMSKFSADNPIQFRSEPYDGGVQCPICAANLHVIMRGTLVVFVEQREVSFAPPEDLSEEPRLDFEEAVRAYNAQCYKATVTLCRRVIDYLTQDLDSAQSLRVRIERLHDTKVLSDTTYHRAQVIRFFGNYGAHPQDDLLKTTSQDEGLDVLRLTKRLLDEWTSSPP